jgi:hypothetical protein
LSLSKILIDFKPLAAHELVQRAAPYWPYHPGTAAAQKAAPSSRCM